MTCLLSGTETQLKKAVRTQNLKAFLRYFSYQKS